MKKTTYCCLYWMLELSLTQIAPRVNHCFPQTLTEGNDFKIVYAKEQLNNSDININLRSKCLFSLRNFEILLKGQ